MSKAICEGSEMKTMEEITNSVPYQRTSTRIEPLRPAVPNISQSTYDGWAKQLNEPPKETKVRGTTRVLVGVVAGMVCASAYHVTYTFQYRYGGRQGFFSGQGFQQYFSWEKPRKEAFPRCNCGQC